MGSWFSSEVKPEEFKQEIKVEEAEKIKEVYKRLSDAESHESENSSSKYSSEESE